MAYSKKSSIAKVFDFVLKISGQKKKVVQLVKKPYRSKRSFVPKHIKNKFQVAVEELNNRIIATLNPEKPSGSKHIVFFHGGGYVFEIMGRHWILIEKLIKKTNCRVSVMNYPLAPEAEYKTTHSWTKEAYNLLIQRFPGDEIILVGDSAGGGLALAFAQTIGENQNIKNPEKMILLSPWLDMSMSNPEIKVKEKSDYLLSKEFLDYCTSIYSKGEDPKNTTLSPIYGPLENLPKTLVFYSSSELFEPDCRLFQKLSDGVEAQITFKLYEGMQHDWLLFPLPESKHALSEISEFLKGD